MQHLLDDAESIRFGVLSTSPRSAALSGRACDVAMGLLSRQRHAPEFVDTRLLPPLAAGLENEPGHVNPVEVDDAIRALSRCDVLVVAGAVHRNQVCGWTRNWIEVFRDALAGIPVLPVLAAGSERGHLAAVAWRADLFASFAACPLPPVLVTEALDPRERDRRIAEGLVALCASLRARA